MKAVAFANNDIAVVAWTFGGKAPGCLGFAVYRIDVRAGTETCLPAMATFPDQDASKPGRTTADDPIQKFYWKDVYAKRGGTYRYKIVPMGGTPGSLQPLTYGPAVSNTIQLSPHYGTLSAPTSTAASWRPRRPPISSTMTAARRPRRSKRTSTRSAIRCATT